MNGAQNGRGADATRSWPVIKLPPDLYAQLVAAAHENQRSIAGEGRYALTLYLRNIERRRQQQQNGAPA